MKRYKIEILVSEKVIQEMYLSQDSNLTPEDLPSLEEMIETELGWLSSSGIQLIGELEEVTDN